MKRLAIFRALLGAAVSMSPLLSGDPGRVQFQRLASPELDRYTNAPNREDQKWFRDHFARMGVFSPYFDSRTAWYPHALAYVNLYGIQPASSIPSDHADWILHDSRGSSLYVPWGCQHITCAQLAANIANLQFRAWWISQMRAVLAKGYVGLWIDDVNMEFRVADGTGTEVAPIDSYTTQPMTWSAWRNYVAAFVEQIRKAFPNAEIVHNAIWFAGPVGLRERDAAIERQIKAADNVNVERGIGSDPHLTGGTGIWSLNALFAYVDRVHQLGRGVTLQEYAVDRAAQEYALAGYFLISSGNDRVGDGNSNPSDWWSGYDVELGSPLGSRTYNGGVFQRKFSCGMVLLSEPGARRQTVQLGAEFTTLEGRRIRSVELSARQGVVLRGCDRQKN
jgi:hypothetical protein